MQRDGIGRRLIPARSKRIWISISTAAWRSSPAPRRASDWPWPTPSFRREREWWGLPAHDPPELDALTGEFLHVPVDLIDPDAPAEVIARTVEAFGGVDILVNNVGGPPPGDSLPHAGFLDRSDADWKAIFELNLFSAVRASRAALPLFIERGSTIVNVSSANGRQPSPFNVDYSAAKAAIINLTKALSEEFGPQGVRVNGVAPGPTVTPWWTEPGGAGDIIAAQAGTDRDAVLSTVAPAMMSLTTGRLADAQRIADAVVWLASPRSASTTGAEFVVDSGLLKAT